MIRILILITLFPLITPFFTYKPVIAIQKRHEIPKDRPVFLFIYYNHCGRSAMTAPAIQKAAKILKKRGIETLSLEYEQTMFEYYKIDPNLHTFPGIYTYAKDGTRSKFPGNPIYVEPEEFVRFVDRNQRHAIDNPMPPVPRRWDDSEEQSPINKNTNTTTTATTTRTTITPAAMSQSASKVISTSAPKPTLPLSTTTKVLPTTSSSSTTTVHINMPEASNRKPVQEIKGATRSSTSQSPSITMKATTNSKVTKNNQGSASMSTSTWSSSTTTITTQAPQIRPSNIHAKANNLTWRKAKVASWQLKQNKRRRILRRPTARRLRRPISVKKQVLNKTNTRARRPLLRKNLRQNSRKLRRPVLAKTTFTSGATTAASKSLDSTITTATNAATTTMTAATSTTATKPPQTSSSSLINLPLTTQTTEWPLSTNQFTNFVTPASPSFNQNLNTQVSSSTTRKWKLIEIVQRN